MQKVENSDALLVYKTTHHFDFTAKSDSVGRDRYFMLWIIAAIISTCYTFTWDIKMDWGLLDKNAGENKFLREETVYRSTVCPSVIFFNHSFIHKK